MTSFDSIEQLAAWLAREGIDVRRWGEDGTKSVENLWIEIANGESILENDPPRRLVEVVRVLIRQGDRTLIEAEQEFANGQRRTRGQPPSEKIRPGESYRRTALRCLEEELGVASQAVHFIAGSYEREEGRSLSDSYPGLWCHYTFHLLQARVEGLPDTHFCTREQARGPGEPVSKHHWVWRELESG